MTKTGVSTFLSPSGGRAGTRMGPVIAAPAPMHYLDREGLASAVAGTRDSTTRGFLARRYGGCHGRREVHHLRKVRDGGAPYALENLVIVCRRHHAGAELLS